MPITHPKTIAAANPAEAVIAEEGKEYGVKLTPGERLDVLEKKLLSWKRQIMADKAVKAEAVAATVAFKTHD